MLRSKSSPQWTAIEDFHASMQINGRIPFDKITPPVAPIPDFVVECDGVNQLNEEA
jgi:hypothetical protein